MQINNIQEYLNKFLNPYGHGIQELCREILKDEQNYYFESIKLLSKKIDNENDYRLIRILIEKIYHKGYEKCLKDQKDSWEKLGYQVKINYENEKLLDDKTQS